MGQVNRIPSGFLDLLDVQSLGKNPPLFSDAISPVLEMRELYLAQTLSAHTEDVTGWTTSGDNVDIFVPNDEAWLLRGLAVYTDGINTGEFAGFAFRLYNLPRETTGGATPDPYIWSTETVGGTSSNLPYILATTLPCPILCTPGVSLQAIAFRLAGTHDFSFTWTFNRLKVG